MIDSWKGGGTGRDEAGIGLRSAVEQARKAETLSLPMRAGDLSGESTGLGTRPHAGIEPCDEPWSYKGFRRSRDVDDNWTVEDGDLEQICHI